MCLGVPGLVIECDELTALVDFWGVRRRVRLDIVDEPVAPGDYVLNHVGFAIRRIPAADVATTLELYEQLLVESERAETEDLMAADVRAEIQAGQEGLARAGGAGEEEGGTGRKGRRRVIGQLEFRDPARARSLSSALKRAMAQVGRSRVRDARLRQPRTGDRPFRPACGVSSGAQRHHGARLSGLHHRPAGNRRGDRARESGRADRDLRRHVARAGVRRIAGRCQGAWRSRRHRLQREPGRRPGPCDERRDRVLCHRVRNHGGGDRGGAAGRRASEFLRALRPQVHSAGDGNRRRDAGRTD